MLKKYYREAKKLVKSDISFSNSLGINSTPTFLWENVLVVSNIPSVLKLIKAYTGDGESYRK